MPIKCYLVSLTWIGAPISGSPRLLYQIPQRIDSGVNLAITPVFGFFVNFNLVFRGQNTLLITT
jgi:hypothetical protein